MTGREQVLFDTSRSFAYSFGMKTLEDPVLQRLKRSFVDIFGERLDKVVLFGSRARGDGREDSDYDVAVFLKDMGCFSREAAAIARVEADILFETGAVINSIPFPVGTDSDATGLMTELRREGMIV